jgi:hypothetical protein
MKKSKKNIYFAVFTRCDVVGTWSREYQLSPYYYYQMRLCRIWSRNAEKSSALFYVVKNVTFFQWCIDCGTFAN